MDKIKDPNLKLDDIVKKTLKFKTEKIEKKEVLLGFGYTQEDIEKIDYIKKEDIFNKPFEDIDFDVLMLYILQESINQDKSTEEIASNIAEELRCNNNA